MRRRDEDILTVLSQFPWWISVCVAGGFYTALKFVIPSMEFEGPILKAAAQATDTFAWVAVIFLLPALVSAIESLRKRKLLDQQSGVESIRSLSWKEFEELVGEAYRRQGYTVRENACSGPDGGIDLILEKGGKVYLVQCKQWRAYKVGVKVVREMLGLMTAHRATGVIVVTCGLFTQESRMFAAANQIELIEGIQLADLVRNVQLPPVSGVLDRLPATTKKCPNCNSDLVVRQARRGSRAGRNFWGCSSYPRCKYTEDHNG